MTSFTHSTLPATSFEFTVANKTSINHNKWALKFRSKDDQPVIFLLGFIVSFIVMLTFPRLVGGHTYAWVVVSGMVALLAAGILASFKLENAYQESRIKRNRAYREANAPAILEALATKGWKPASSGDSLTDGNNIHVLDKNNVRYSLQNMYIRDEEIIFRITLNDRTVDKAYADKDKQSRIDFLVQRYETENGTMSEEQKAVFIAALEMSL